MKWFKRLFKRKPKFDPVIEAMSLYNGLVMVYMQRQGNLSGGGLQNAGEAAAEYLGTYYALRRHEASQDE